MQNRFRIPNRGGALFLALLLGAWSATSALASGSFTMGDLYLLSYAIPGYGDAILRIDPALGTTSLLADLSGGIREQMSYDPVRDRLIYLKESTGSLMAVDAAGNVTDLVPAFGGLDLLAAGTEGRVYVWNSYGDGNNGFQWLDAADGVHDLLNQAGTGRYALPGQDVSGPQEMIYDPGTNALILFTGSSANLSTCGDPSQSCIVKIPLTAGRDQVAGPISATQVEVSASGESVEGASLAPNGRVLFVVDTNTDATEPRIQLLDPATMTTTVYATPGNYFGAPSSNAGTYSRARGQAVVLDTLVDILRAFDQGEYGGGGLQVASGVSSGGGSAEAARLIEISSASAAAMGGGGAIASPALALSASPSPFSSETRLTFALPAGGYARLSVLDACGRSVRRLAGESLPAGEQTVLWNGRDDTGRALPTGVYFLSLRTAAAELRQKLILTR